MKVLHLLTSGEVGGIERLCSDIATYSNMENTFCFVTKGGEIYDKMLAGGRNVISLQKMGGLISVNKLVALVRLAKINDVMIVHHGDVILKMYYILVKRLTNIHGVTVNHSCYSDTNQVSYNRIKLKLMDIVFQKCFDVSDAVWSVSHAGEASCMKRYKIDAYKCKVIYNGISPDILDGVSRDISKHKNSYKILYIGRLVQIKGVDLLIDAFFQVAKSYNVTLSIVGDGDEREKLEEKIAELGLNDLVTFYGTRTDISNFLQVADIFVYPSICQEVFGISIVEAMAFSLPCIVNNVGGIPEIIRNGENGYITRENTPQEIARLIGLVICKYDDETIRPILENARKTAEHFSVCNTCKIIENELGKLFDGNILNG